MIGDPEYNKNLRDNNWGKFRKKKITTIKYQKIIENFIQKRLSLPNMNYRLKRLRRPPLTSIIVSQ